MEIIINRTKNKKLVTDEANTIIISYKKLLKNPNKKIIRINTRLILNIIFLVIYLLLLSLYTYFYNTNIIFPILIGITLSLIIINVGKYIVYNKKLNKLSKIDSNAVLIIDEEKVTLNKNSNMTCFTEWKNIIRVLITKNCIVFMTDNKNSYLIIIPSCYEKEVLEALKKYNKLDLLMYNCKER